MFYNIFFQQKKINSAFPKKDSKNIGNAEIIVGIYLYL